jgi:bifunctional oligoribonuclease and PAP phosphatase NrnA
MTVVDRIADYLAPLRRVLISSHARPDGDSIGSQLAAAAGLEQLGKSVEIVNRDAHPPNYRMLPGIERIRIRSAVEGDFDCALILECNNLDRTEVTGLERFPIVNIDHHPINDSFGVLNWVDSSFAAVAEMVLPLLKRLGAVITPEIATNLYVGLLTDTGSFRFSNTSPAAMRAAAELIESGADPAGIAEEVLMRQSASRLRLTAGLLGTFERDPSGRIAWVVLEQSLVKKSGAAPNDTEGLVNFPMSVDGVLICAFFREEPDGGWKVSLRSKGQVDIGRVAQFFGGGGHRNASGFSYPRSPLPVVRDAVLDRLLAVVDARE